MSDYDEEDRYYARAEGEALDTRDDNPSFIHNYGADDPDFWGAYEESIRRRDGLPAPDDDGPGEPDDGPDPDDPFDLRPPTYLVPRATPAPTPIPAPIPPRRRRPRPRRTPGL